MVPFARLRHKKLYNKIQSSGLDSFLPPIVSECLLVEKAVLGEGRDKAIFICLLGEDGFETHIEGVIYDKLIFPAY